jgi:hypothetical protein
VEAGTVNTAKIVLVVSVVLVGSVVVPAAYAQEAKGAQEAKQPPDLRMLLTQPLNRVPAGAAAVPDLRDVPMPKMDKPPVQPPITIMLGDPRCYPGEDALGDFAQFNRRSRRSH